MKKREQMSNRETVCPVCEDRKRRGAIADMQFEQFCEVAGVILAPFWVLAILWLLVALIKFGFT